MHDHEKINYLEFPARDIEKTKTFFTAIFNWSFVDYGPEYSAFANAGIDGGFFKSEQSVSAENGSVLVVFYSKNLEETQVKIKTAGGSIIKETFSFPGGRRFHFSDPNGNEYAVWSDLNTPSMD
ncbi:Glyoxalase family protein [hydrothermal vent metagenome]|uniref:Glyoxalase family protein n=1 Tax=hydrothermal vent metagenome TaxID=652676 RepID=A0A3B1D8S3_9ZZZZ